MNEKIIPSRDHWSISISAEQEFYRTRNPVGYARFRRYRADILTDGVSLAWWHVSRGKNEQFGVACDIQFPETILVSVVGKPILEVISHPLTIEAYGPADVIERAWWDDVARLSVFEVRRAA